MNAAQRAEAIRMDAMKRAERSPTVGSIFPVVAGHLAHEVLILCREVEGLKRDIEELKGLRHQSEAGFFSIFCPFYGASVLVEFEEEDGAPLTALINGRWVDQDRFPEDATDKWIELGKKHIEQLKRDAQEARAIRLAEAA
jgi:hypothetical protein